MRVIDGDHSATLMSGTQVEADDALLRLLVHSLVEVLRSLLQCLFDAASAFDGRRWCGCRNRRVQRRLGGFAGPAQTLAGLRRARRPTQHSVLPQGSLGEERNDDQSEKENDQTNPTALSEAWPDARNPHAQFRD